MTQAMKDSELAQEAMFHALAKRGQLSAGATYAIDHASGLVSSAMVWALSGIWYFDHYHPGNPNYDVYYAIASTRSRTLHRARTA